MEKTLASKTNDVPDPFIQRHSTDVVGNAEIAERRGEAHKEKDRGNLETLKAHEGLPGKREAEDEAEDEAEADERVHGERGISFSFIIAQQASNEPLVCLY